MTLTERMEYANEIKRLEQKPKSVLRAVMIAAKRTILITSPLKIKRKA